jgi:hypothetical protein
LQSVPRFHDEDHRKVSQQLMVGELVVSEQSQLVVGHERGSRRISTVRSCYLTKTSEDITN